MDLGQPEEKRAYNQALFRVVAPAYRRVTRLLSFGQDRRWKRILVQDLPEIDRPVCVDLAAGTGDISALLLKRYPAARVIGLDQNQEMLKVGRAQNDRGQVMLIQGDMGRIPMANAQVDIVTGGYAIRNAPDLKAAIAEMHRVLKPGGVAALLDFSKSPSRVSKGVALGLLKFWGGLVGLLYHRNPEVYGYIASSLIHFPDRNALARLFEAEGFEAISTRLFFGGMVSAMWARKRESLQ